MPAKKLLLPGVPTEIGASLSALVPIGDAFWLGADEGTSLALARTAGSDPAQTFELVSLLDLPAKEAPEKDKDKASDNDKKKDKDEKKDDGPKEPATKEEELPEVDAEGMDWDGQHLWIIGSHSLKRKKTKEAKAPKPPKEGEKEPTAGEKAQAKAKADADNFVRLARVEADGNRYLLGRLPVDSQGELGTPSPPTAEHCAARLTCDLFGSDLLEELRKDDLLTRFLPAEGEESKEHNLPGKDNGLDIEGLAAIGRDHLLIGLRGPVLRGWALVLELRLTCGKPPADGKPATLELEKLGERKYRRLAFQLGGPDGGLGVRDLCFDKNGDLLILAGPTMVLPWPVQVFRWPGAKAELGKDTDDHFIWGKELRLELHYTPPSVNDRAESLCILGTGAERRLVIGYDNEERVNEAGDLELDAFPITTASSHGVIP